MGRLDEAQLLSSVTTSIRTAGRLPAVEQELIDPRGVVRVMESVLEIRDGVDVVGLAAGDRPIESEIGTAFGVAHNRLTT
jgi:hypothetical protein